MIGGRGSFLVRRKAEMIESLESRSLFSSAVDASGVGLYRSDGGAAGLDPLNGDAWLVIHSLGSSKDDSTMQLLAAAVEHARPADQVRLVDWSSLADPPDGKTALRNALAAADA